MYTIIDLGQLGEFGLTYWLPLASAANVAQGGAALAVALKTRDKKLKAMALPASLSAFMGITEPAIFGVNLRFLRPFIAGSIGGACGALYASITHLGATGTGVTGIFGVLLHLHRPLTYVIAMLIAAGVAFVLSWILGIKTEEPAEESTAPQTTAPSIPQSGEADVYAPLSGKVVPLSETGDETFASGVLGKGAAIVPNEGKVVAPCAATVAAVMGHAVALEADTGVELLIHVGVNTVELNGKHYTPHVQAGDHVTPGQTLLEFDIPAIQKAGYPVITPVIVTNADDFAAVETVAGTDVQRMDALLAVRR